MYTFHIKNNGPDIDLVLTRAMLGLAGIACFLYGSDKGFFSLAIAIILFLAALFTKMIFSKYRVNKLLILAIAALLLFFVTGSVSFAIILVAYGMLAKNFYSKNIIEVTREGIYIRRFFKAPVHPWQELNNVVLKDNLLTIDFTNNKLLQLTIDEKNAPIDEPGFNRFCSGLITSNSLLA